MDKAEAILEETLKIVFKNSASGMAILTKDGKFLETNKTFCKMLGYSESEFAKLDCKMLTHPEDLELMGEKLKIVLEGKKTTTWLEKRCIHKSKKILWMHMNLIAIIDESNLIERIFVEIQDITKQKEAETKLENSEEKLSIAVEGASIGLWDWNIETGEIYWSDIHKKQFGIKDNGFEATFDEFQRRLHPDDEDYLQNAIQEHLEKNKPYNAQFRMKHNKGHYVWIHAKGKAFRDENGKPIRMAGSANDISERKKIEEELAITQERFDLALKGSSVGLWDWDLETGIIFCSDRTMDILSVKKKQNFKLLITDIKKRLHPKDYPLVKKAIDNHLNKHKPFDMEYRLKKFDGNYIWIHAKGQAVCDKDGNPIRIAGSIDDITERKEIADKLEAAEFITETLIESSYDGYWDWHIKDDYEYMSPRFWEMFGYKPEEKKHYPSEWQKILTPESLERSQEAFEKHVKSRGEYPLSLEVEYIHKNGSPVYILCRGKAIEWDENWQPIRVVGTHTNLTELRTAQRQLEEYAKKLEKSNESLDYFSYIISHDLKEPVRGISNNTLFLKEDYGHNLEKGAIARLDRISLLCDKMDKMINDLFHFSRLKNQELCVAQVDLNPIIKEIKSAYEEDDIKIILKKKLPKITCNEVTMKELFINLIANAIKYNDKEQKNIEIGFLKKHKDKKDVFYVKDNGIGIEKKYFDQIFHIFKRLDSNYGNGTGFGLSLVKKIVENHHGEIWLESELGKGSSFYFTLG